MWRKPVGEGANRVTTVVAGAPAGDPGSELALNRACSQADEHMATIAEGAPSTRIPWLQTQAAWWRRARNALETVLEAERDQLPLWLPVALGTGIAAGMFPQLLGALVSRYFFEKKFGLSWRQYAPVLLAGFSCGMGLISMFSLGCLLISKAVFQLPY